MVLSSSRYAGHLREVSAIPGFRLTLDFTTLALSLVVLIPMAALMLKAFSIGLPVTWVLVRYEFPGKAHY
jgi:ABC-type sulfate transport system permease component